MLISFKIYQFYIFWAEKVEKLCVWGDDSQRDTPLKMPS